MAAARGALSRVFWARVDAGEGQLSDAFRVKFSAEAVLGAEGEGGGWQSAVVQDLKEQVVEQAGGALTLGSAVSSASCLAWVYLWLPPDLKGKEDALQELLTVAGEANPGWTLLSGSTSLSALPAGAGSPSRPLVVRVRPPGASPTSPQQRRQKPRREPQTLFEKGIAGKDEPPQIRDALDLSDLYPGGVLPASGPNDLSVPVLKKLFVVFTCALVVGGALMYFLGSVLPELLGPPGAVPVGHGSSTIKPAPGLSPVRVEL